MSAVVCNAGPLIALAGIGQIELLHHLFGQVLIADEVRKEVEAGGVSGKGQSIFVQHEWLEVVLLPQKPDPLLTAVLDLGEAATLALALHRQASVVLMDEAKGRKIARGLYHLPVVGTGRVLVEAKQAGVVIEVKPLLDEIRKNGYWLSDRIVAEILRLAGE